MIDVPSKKAVAKAGAVLSTHDPSTPEYVAAMETLSSWRSLYAHPLNAFNVLLRRKCKLEGLAGSSIVARRLKRAPSIVAKLKRNPKMQLNRMQDIGGLRVIVDSVEDVRNIHQSILSSQMGHEVVIPCDDYILQPKPDGYRSLHQVFKYHSEDSDLTNLGLRVEVQIRTKIQHSWATAVETLGVIEKAAFKSGEGKQDFKRFFILSSALLSILEEQPVVESLKDVSPQEIVREFTELEKDLHVFQKLQGVAVTVKELFSSDKKTAYYLMELDEASRRLSLWQFEPKEEEIAEVFYQHREKINRSKDNIETVLISVDSLKQVRRAYPNYFLDCNAFISNLQKICRQIEGA